MQSFLDPLPQHIINGLTLGALYALIALGYSLVYGVLQLLNFAHGDVFMIGAFIGYGVMAGLMPYESLPPALIIAAMFIAAMLGCGILGMVIEQYAYRPLRNSPRIAPLISALGVSFFIQSSIQLTLTASFRSYPTAKLIPPDKGLEFFDARISATRILVIVTTLVLMVALTYLVRYTRLGRAMRAVATDREAAAMMGINVDRVIVATFFIGSALAGAAGVMNGLVFFRIWHFMGFSAGLKGFTAAVLGGIGVVVSKNHHRTGSFLAGEVRDVISFDAA